MKKTIKFAIIGCGNISKKHVTAIFSQSNSELVGAYDIDKNMLKSFKADNSTIPTFSSIEELHNQCNPDVFCVLTPSGEHISNIKELIKYKKNIVVEKPLALRVDDAEEIIKSCKSEKIGLYVCLQNRFNPPIVRVKEALELGAFGKLVIGTVRARWMRKQSYYDQKEWRGTWKSDGGVLLNQACHHIDALLWFMGDVKSVLGMSATRLVNIEAEDTGVAILKFVNGALGVIEATTATRPIDLGSSISVLGEEASIEIGGYFMNEIKTWNFEKDVIIEEEDKKVPNTFAWNHSKFYENVIDSLLNKKEPLITGEEGKKSLKLINAIYDSIALKKEIFLEEYKPSNLLPLGNKPKEEQR